MVLRGRPPLLPGRPPLLPGRPPALGGRPPLLDGRRLVHTRCSSGLGGSVVTPHVTPGPEVRVVVVVVRRVVVVVVRRVVVVVQPPLGRWA